MSLHHYHKYIINNILHHAKLRIFIFYMYILVLYQVISCPCNRAVSFETAAKIVIQGLLIVYFYGYCCCFSFDDKTKDINSPDSNDSGIQADVQHIHGPINDDIYAVVQKPKETESRKQFNEVFS